MRNNIDGFKATTDDGSAWFKVSGESKETTAPFGVVTVCSQE